MSLTMVLYPFVASLTLDASSGNVVGGATGEVYSKADTTFTTPLAAVDASGNPVTLTSNANGVLPSFYVDGHTSVNWVSGSWVFPLVTSEPVEGPEGPAGVSVNGATATGDDLVFSLSNGSTTPPVKLPTGAGGSDAGVASYITTPGTETAAALSATIASETTGKLDKSEGLSFYTVARRNTIALMGDSITYANRYTGGILTFNLRGFWGSAARRLGQRLEVVSHAGISGQTTTQMLARFDADIVAKSPGWLHLLGGTNDVSGGVALATIQANLTAMLDKARAAGIRTIIGTIPPNNNIPTTTDDRYKTLQQLNEWIMNLGITDPDLTVIDYYTLLADPVTGHYAANLTPTGDGTHPSAQGAARMGKALAAILAPMVPPRNDLPTSNLDIPGRGLKRENIGIGKPMMTGTTGTKGTGVTGTVADGWALNPAPSNTVTAIGTVQPRTDGGPGNWQKIEVQAGSARLYGLNGNVGVHYNVGDQVYAECELKSDAGWASVSEFRLRVMVLGASNAQLVTADDFGWANIADETWAAETQPGADGAVVMRTATITIPAGVTNVYPEVVAKLVGTVYITRLAVRRIVPA